MDFTDLAVPAVRQLVPYIPGKPISELEREIGRSSIVKLASNENPLGPSPRALAAMSAVCEDLHLYPDGGGFSLKAALSKHLSVDAERITLGNGSNDVLDILARTFLSEGVSAVFSEYAFAVYSIITQAVGAKAHIATAHDGSVGPRYGHNLGAFLKAIQKDTRVVFIANPNNPTGTFLTRPQLASFLSDVPQHIIVVIDEAYFEYVEDPHYPNALDWIEAYPNLVVSRTFSKAYGLAGLRVGYTVSHPDLAALMNRVRQPFNVNTLALVAAEASLRDETHLDNTVTLNRLGLKTVSEALLARGFDIIPSVGNFVSFDLGVPSGPIYSALLHAGVIVRPIGNYGLPNHLRVSLGTPDENQLFLEGLDQVVHR